MQILMGANETIVRINNNKIYTQNLINFMQTQFSLYTQKQKSIVILYHINEYHKRIYLMKWLYSMYVKISKINIPNMKQLLIDRIEKPIKIQFIEEIFKAKKQTSSKENNQTPKRKTKENKLSIAMNLLNITELDSQKMMKKKYKKLLVKYHPDKVFHESQEKIEQYTKKFQEIQSSYLLVMEYYNNKSYNC